MISINDANILYCIGYNNELCYRNSEYCVVLAITNVDTEIVCYFSSKLHVSFCIYMFQKNVIVVHWTIVYIYTKRKLTGEYSFFSKQNCRLLILFFISSNCQLLITHKLFQVIT